MKAGLVIAGAAAALAVSVLQANRAQAPTRRLPTIREMLEPDAVEDAPEAPPPPEGAQRVYLRPIGPRWIETSGPPRESATGRAAARRRRQMARQKGQPDE